MLYLFIGIALLILGILVFGMSGSISLKKRDEHGKKNPYDESNYPPNNGDEGQF